MIRRILRSTVVLIALVAAYQAYVTFAVPQMEPSLALQQKRKTSQDDRDRAGRSVSNYQLLLRNYFPAGHWSQSGTPKILGNASEQGILVIDSYTRHEEQSVGETSVTQLDINRFALLVFPTPLREGLTPPRDTIILEAPQGAKLQFDDFHPERGRIGQITRGSFPGKITIRSDMREPGPEDDLLVEAADLEMNSKLLYSNSPVRFRLGPNVGGGRELEIRFLVDEHKRPRDQGFKMSSFESLEIRRDVRMRMQLETSSLLPGKANAGSQADKGNATSEPKPPVEVTCSGPFLFDFVLYRASVDRDVEVRQLNPNGPSDQLSCNQLDIHFAPRPRPAGTTEQVVAESGDQQHRDLGRLEPSVIVAQGHPVVIVSPAKSAEARGDRIQIALRDQRVRIEGGRDAVLVSGDNVLRAPTIDYQHPESDAGPMLGRFQATGPGTLHYVPDPEKPQQVFRAAWQKSVQLGREKGQPVLVLDGRPQFGIADAGSLAADQIRVYLRELDGKSGAGIAISSGSSQNSKLRIAPDRLVAVGNVEIASPQMTGRTGKLTATFRIKPAAPADGSQPASTGGGPLIPTSGAEQSGQRFNIDANEVRLDVDLMGQSASPSAIECVGNVAFREVPAVQTDQQPMEIRGGHLTVDQLQEKTPHIILRGAAPGEQPGEKLAQIAGRGMTMLVDSFEAEGRDSRLWSDGHGRATMLVTRDLQGRASNQPFPLDITWQGGMQFDGRTITFNDQVLVASDDSKLRCDRLSATLTAPIQFGQPIDQANINLSEIDCQGQVRIDSLTRDTGGVTSHERAQLARLTINQQTGAISGAGPGVLRSTRFGSGLAALTGPQDPAAPQLVSPPPGAAGSKLNFLRVDFHDGLSGNLYTRELKFFKLIRTVYGPVDAWEQELDLNRPEDLPPDSMTLTCDELRLNEDPIASRAAAKPGDGNRPIGYVQMRAHGNVKIAGELPGQGDFTVEAETASYEQAKDAFILEGNTRMPAKLWRRTKEGVNRPPAEAQWIRYVRSTNEAEVKGIQFIEITPDDVESARRPTTPRSK
jgi:lipopolysaccharide export system protein LptA